MLRKKAQTVNAGNAAVLVMLIMFVIIMYVLVLPPAEREELLGDNETSEEEKDEIKENESILLEEHIGRLDFVDEREYEHTIPSFYLYKTTESVEIRNINPFIVRNAVFDSKGYDTSFFVKDLENTKNVFLSFHAKTHVGVLSIMLNGIKIFEGDINSYNVDPISLADDLLQDRNTLEFSVSDVGWQFWKANEYHLDNVRIIGDVTDVSRQESRNIFYITSVEKENLDRAHIKFSPECSPGSVGRMEVYINNNVVFSGVPDCGILNTHEFSPAMLLSGSNSVVFRTEEGSYLVDLIEIKTKLKKTSFVVFYFELNSTQYDDVLHDRVNVNMSLEFVDDDNLKEAKIIINGHETGMFTRRRIYSRIIDPYIQRKNNAIKIVPKETLDIITLTVKLED